MPTDSNFKTSSGAGARAVRLIIWLAIVVGLAVGAGLAHPQPAAASIVPHMPSAAEIDEQMRQAAGSMPNLNALTPMSPNEKIDLGAMAARAERMNQPPGSEATVRDAVSGLLIFVSLGMPRETMDRLVDQAVRYHAHLVLRGLKNRSIKQTAREVRAILHDRPVSWLIDPKAYARFMVNAVPTFVLVDPSSPMPMGCEGPQCSGASFSKLTGDVSTEFALREMAASDAQLGHVAADLLAQAAEQRR